MKGKERERKKEKANKQPGLQNVSNPASAACRQGPNFVGRNGSWKKKERKERGKKRKEK